MESIMIDDLIQSYFDKENIVISHQINSYNYYVDEIIPDILSQFFPITLNYTNEDCIISSIKLCVNNLRVGEPRSIENNGCSELMTPHIARIRNSSYVSPLIVDFTSIITIKEKDTFIELQEKIIPNIVIGKIPIMVNSKYCILSRYGYDNECKYDLGGYFIINGNVILKYILDIKRSIYSKITKYM